MVSIYSYGGIQIYVYPNDHGDPHCHVYFDECEIKIFLPSYRVQILSERSPSISDISKVIELVKQERNAIGKTWRKYHGN